jgi:ATP adenylyltransferase
MDRLWAPWRMKYIRESLDREEPDKSEKACIFCTKPAESRDRENLILYRGVHAFVMLNAFPYNNGHLLVIPYRHTSSMDDIDAGASAELWLLLAKSRSALSKAFNPDGFNVGINLGRAAGAGIDTHLHVHIVPRWSGDSNFMPVIGETKVISQSLEDAYDALKGLF